MDDIEINYPYSSLVGLTATSSPKEIRDKVEDFKSFVQKSKINHHVVSDLLNFCLWMKDRPDLDLDLIEEECVVPIMKFFLEDPNQEVCKTAYNHLAVMINRGKLSKQSIENHFCSYLAKVINDTFSDDFRLQTINTIFEIIFFIDKEVIAREIMPEITKLCLNPNADLDLKTACVSRLDKLASKLERELTEKTIIPLYEKMSKDKCKIRKNCVEVSVALSYICSKEIREEILVPIYLKFLKDPLSYVSDLALIALGPFIASFANTNENSEHHQIFNEVLVNNIYNFNYGKINIDFNLSNFNMIDQDYDPRNEEDADTFFANLPKDFLENLSKKTNLNDFDSNSDLKADEQDVEMKDEFNSFNYWREPIMDVEELIKEECGYSQTFGNLSSDDIKNYEESKKEEDKKSFMNECYDDKILYDYIKKKNYSSDAFDDDDTSGSFKMNHLLNESPRFDLYDIKCAFDPHRDVLNSNIDRCLKMLKDSNVPKELLFYFLKNLLSVYGSNIYQADINCICAFSLPAVAYTLGQKNWPCLASAFNLLVLGLSTNIRLILASSLHELAKIIGPVHTNQDILPALFTLMKHSDEVRERILKNLSQLVSIFDKKEQKQILRNLPQFYKLENEYNWRFRVEFIKQFTNLISLYDSPKLFDQIIIPMIFSFLEDKVAEVRKFAIPLLIHTIQHLSDPSKIKQKTQNPLNANKLIDSILDQMNSKLYLNKKWTFRQLFIQICEQIILEDALNEELFKIRLLKPLISLAKDKVNNVRLTLSRMLSNLEIQRYFKETNLKAEIDETIQLLTNDEDADVRGYLLFSPISLKDAEDTVTLIFGFEKYNLGNKLINDLADSSLMEQESIGSNSLNSIEKLTNQIPIITETNLVENLEPGEVTLDEIESLVQETVEEVVNNERKNDFVQLEEVSKLDDQFNTMLIDDKESKVVL